MVERYLAISFDYNGKVYGRVTSYDSEIPGDVTEALKLRNLTEKGKARLLYEGSEKKQAKDAVSGMKGLKDLVMELSDEDISKVFRAVLPELVTSLRESGPAQI